jgi:hypothetical protein
MTLRYLPVWRILSPNPARNDGVCPVMMVYRLSQYLVCVCVCVCVCVWVCVCVCACVCARNNRACLDMTINSSVQNMAVWLVAVVVVMVVVGASMWVLWACVGIVGMWVCVGVICYACMHALRTYASL